MLTSPHIRLFLMLALIFAVAPLCVSVTCEPCVERSSAVNSGKGVEELAIKLKSAAVATAFIAFAPSLSALKLATPRRGSSQVTAPTWVLPLRI